MTRSVAGSLKAFVALFLMAFALPAFAESAIELVQSVPIETGLEVPGVRPTHQVWLDMINSARSTIDLEEFYVDSRPGEILEPILNAIAQAAARGVHVRLLVDSKFYKNYSRDPNRLSTLANVRVETIDFGNGVQHAKFFIVDHVEVYSGSANFDWLALKHIHEIGLHVRDADVASRLGAVFEKDWADGVAVRGPAAFGPAARPPLQESMSNFLTSNDLSNWLVVASPSARNPNGMPDSLTAMLHFIDSAQTALRIQVYQYSLKGSHAVTAQWTVLDSALRRAASRGVHVQLMVDAVALKQGGAALKALASQANIDVRAVVIPEWSGGHLDYARLIHSKYFTVDGATSWVGSENWSEGYFTGSRNVGILVQSASITAQLDQIFERIWTSPYATAL